MNSSAIRIRMEQLLQIKYDRKIIRRARIRYMAKRLGWLTLFLLLLLAMYLAPGAILGSWSIWHAVVAVVWSITVGLIAIVYVARAHASEGFFKNSSNFSVEFQFTDEGVSTSSEMGSSFLKWKVFDEILKFPDLWLLVYNRSGYITLPTSSLTEDCKRLLDSKVTVKGKAPWP